MTCVVFENPMNNKKEDNLASSQEGVGTDNFKISNVHLPDIVERKEKNKYEKEPEKAEQHSENVCPRKPHVMYAKFIRTNARFLNEPVGYIDCSNMKDNQEDWWSHGKILKHRRIPSYDPQSTQRSDFKIPACQLVLPTKYNKKQKPACGIVPLAISEPLPELQKKFVDHFPFIHRFDIRKSPSQCMRPKRHGAFLQTEIKPVKGSIAPKGTEVFRSAPGSGLPQRSKTKKGNSVANAVTSPNFCQPHSQESPIFESHLSETDVHQETKAYFTAPGKEQKSPRITQRAEVNFLLPPKEEPLYPPIKQSCGKISREVTGYK